MAKHFKNLKILKLDNTSLLEKLKANELIESVSLLNSNILSVNSFKKKVPEPLLARNNMANYTQIKLNGVLLSESEIAKLKLGKMNVEHNDRIEVMDGILAGAIFTIILGTPLNELIKDQVLLTHVKELLNKESASSLVSFYELQTITWLGKNPAEITELNYLGYFNTKTIGNMETFKNDLKQFPNLTYINLAGAIFTTDLNLNDFNLTNFKYSFANCTLLQNLILDKTIVDLEGAFRNCQNLRNVTIGENANLSNMVKTFYGCKGILNFTINNPNMTDTDNANVFEESLISTLTFTKEPINNVITSNLLKRAIYSSSTLNLDNKNRPDLYNLTSTGNAKLEKLTLNSTNIEEIDLTKATTNFTNLKYLEANNTNKLQNFKLNGSNLTNVSFTNSSVLYQKINTDETPKMFIENKDYYSRVSINSVELTEAEILKLKEGTYKFNHADVIEFLNGPLLNISFKITTGMSSDILSNVFPDPTLAEYIRIKLNKTTINDIITQDDLDTILYFGHDSLEATIITSSWFSGKTVNSWVGTEYLKKIQNILLKGVSGTANEIVITSKEIKTLAYAFSGCTSLTSVTLPTELPNLTDLSYAFSGCTSLTSVTLPTSMPGLLSLDFTFESCTSLKSITLPKRLPLLTNSNMLSIFKNCNLDEVYIHLSKTVFNLGSNSTFDNATVKKIIVREPDIGDTDPIVLVNLCAKSISTSIIIECQGSSNEKIFSLSNVFNGCTSLTSITLPTSMPNLDSLLETFIDCTSLTSIALPTSMPNLTSLYSAFKSCTSLTSIALPTELPNLTNLYSAFENCTSLTSITLPTELPNLTNLSYAFGNCKKITSITFPKRLPKMNTANSVLENCNLDLINIPLPTKGFLPTMSFLQNAIVKKIIVREPDTGDTEPINLSYMCNYLLSTSIILECQGSSNEKINNLSYTFRNCRKLTSIILPDKLPNLDNLSSIFENCIALTSITLPAKLPKVTTRLVDTYLDLTGRTIIYGSDDTVTRLNEIKYHNATTGVTEYLQSTLDYTNLGNLVLDYPPGQIKQLFPDPTLAEYIRIKLNKTTTSEKITQADLNTITYFGFDGLYQVITSVSWFNGKTVNSWKGVEHLTAIKNVLIKGVLGTADTITIKSRNIVNLAYAFNSCRNLTTIEFLEPMDNLTDLSSAFTFCSGLTSITLPTSLPKLHNFYGGFSNCSSLTTLTLPTSMPMVYNLNKICFSCTSLVSVTLASELPALENIADAFNNCSKLENISQFTQLNNLSEASSIFRGCSALKRFTFPVNLPKLQYLDNSFYSCETLEYVKLPETAPLLRSLNNTFNYCRKLTTVILPNELPVLTNMSNLFQSCNLLASIFLPPILPKLTTSLASTYLEGTNRTYIYHANPEVDDVQKITLHPNLGTKDYSKLTNLLTFGQAFLDDILSQYICSKLSLNTNSPMDSSRLNLIIELTDFPNGITNFEGLKYCKKLEYVSFKNQTSYRVINLKHCVNIKRLNDSFSGCTNLQSLELPDILTNATSFENMLLNCNNLTLLTITNINDYRLIKEIDKSNLTVCFKGEAENIEEIYLLNELIYANLKLSNEHYEKKLSFFFSKNLKEAVKTKLSLQGEDPIVTITQLDSIEDLTINTQYYFDENLGFLVLKNLKVLTIENNSSLRNLNLKFLKSPLAEININNCPNLYSLFLPIYDSFSGEVNINLLDGHKIKEIFANKKINLDYPGIKKNY